MTALDLKIELRPLQYHSNSFKYFEREIEKDWKTNIVGNISMNKIINNPGLIYNLESFLFQSKSCLDVLAQLIAYSFKFRITSYGDNGNGLIQILKKPSKNNPEYAKKMIAIIDKNKPWVKELVVMRDEVTHYSDLEGLSCFLIKRSEKKDIVATVYYPVMTALGISHI